MKKMFLTMVLAFVMAFGVVPAFALDLGYTISHSEFGKTTSGVTTQTDSFHAVGVLGSGLASGGSLAGGQAVTTHDLTGLPTGNSFATQNFGEAIGGFTFYIQTGNKGFWFFPPMAGAIAGTKGDVSQGSINWSNISGLNGTAGSSASQNSAAGFAGADGALLIGKNKGPVTGEFTGDSAVQGYTYTSSWKEPGFVGTMSGAGNSAETVITGGFGNGYAGGSGQTSGGSSIDGTHGSTSGAYAGQFSYSGNGSGEVYGSSTSTWTSLPYGATFKSFSGVSVK